MAELCFNILFLILTISLIAGVCSSATFTLVNKCDFTVWPGISSKAGTAPVSTTGFALQIGESKIIDAPPNWGGRFWGRTHCTEDSAGKFSCATGDCGSGKLECGGGGAAPPATLAEFKLNGDSGNDFYDVSLVDGYNLPMLVVPLRGTGVGCMATGCVVDLNGACPRELGVMRAGVEGVACKSACEAFRTDQYCCSGSYSKPDACKPTQYSMVFKNACPRAYSYAYDDKTSTFTCTGADYVITFCPSHRCQKSSTRGLNTSNSQLGRNMVHDGASDATAAPSTTLRVLAAIWLLLSILIFWRFTRWAPTNRVGFWARHVMRGPLNHICLFLNMALMTIFIWGPANMAHLTRHRVAMKATHSIKGGKKI